MTWHTHRHTDTAFYSLGLLCLKSDGVCFVYQWSCDSYRSFINWHIIRLIATLLFDLQILLIFPWCQNRYSNQLTQGDTQSEAQCLPQWSHIRPIRGRVLIISDSFIRKWCKDNCQVESEVVRTVLNFQPISGHTDSQVDQWEGSKGLLVSW